MRGPQSPGPVGALRDHVGNPLHRHAYTLMLNHASSAALGVAYWVLVARLYDAEAVGRNAALIATLMFLSMVAQVGLKDAMTRFLARSGHRARSLVLRAYVVVVACSVVAGLAWVGVATAIGGGDGFGNPALAAWLVVSVASTAIFYVQDGVLSGVRRPGLVLAENGAYNVVKIVALVALVHVSPSYGILLSWTAPMPVAVAWISWVIFRRLIPRHAGAEAELPSRRALARWVAGDHLGALFTEAAARLLPLIVVHELGDAANAYYYQAAIIASMLPLLAGSTTTSMIVESANRPHDSVHLARRALLHMLALVLPVGLLGILAAPWILRVFGPEYADNGTTTLRLLLAAILPGIAVIWYLGYARATNRIRSVVVMQAVASVVTLVLAWLLVGRHGIAGAGIAWLGGQACAAVLALVQGRDVLLGHAVPAVAAPMRTGDVPGSATPDR